MQKTTIITIEHETDRELLKELRLVVDTLKQSQSVSVKKIIKSPDTEMIEFINSLDNGKYSIPILRTTFKNCYPYLIDKMTPTAFGRRFADMLKHVRRRHVKQIADGERKVILY